MRPCTHFVQLFSSRSVLHVIQMKMGCASTKLINKKTKYASSILDESDMKIQTILQVSSNNSKSRKLHKTSKSRSGGDNISSTSSSKQRKKKSSEHKSSSSKHSDKHNHNKVGKNRSIKERQMQSNYDARITAKYNIKALIGKGTYSRVLRVENRITKQPYALKVIEAPSGKDTFEAELTVLRRVNHENVIKLIEVFDSNSKVYMVMELATGGNLLDRLETRGSFSEDESRNIMKMVVSGVKYLHNVGISHRDLKPDNLLYYHPGANSRIMITDFGLASTRKANGSPFMHTICGTPQYIAPEIVARKPYTCAVDMWAIGVITYVVLLGTFPFDGENDAQIFKLILQQKLNMVDSAWRDFSKEAKSFILDLLQHNPAQRMIAAKALGHPWLTSAKLTYSQESINNLSRKSSSADNRDPSQRSTLSVGSSGSGRSISSLRSGHHRVQLHHLEALSSDPELSGLIL